MIAPATEISGYTVIERLLSSPQFKLQPRVNFIYRMRLDFAKYSLTQIAQITLEKVLDADIEQLRGFLDEML
jgi:hypothetical protein